MSPRLMPLEPPYDDDIGALLAKWMPPGAAVEPLKLFRTMAHHKDLFDRMRPLGAGILGRGTIDPAEREIVIDRVCARCGCDYEWGVHVTSFGAAVGLSPEKLAATVTATADDPIWTERESLLIRLVDELHDTSTVSDALYAELAKNWDKTQLIELTIINGFYHLIAYIANTFHIAPEDWAARFPSQSS